MRKNSIKNTRINQEVLRVLSSVIRHDMKDPRIAVMTSVTDVIVAPDLKTCKVYISVYGLENEKDLKKGLKSASGWLRHELSQRLHLRYTPELIFELDNSIEHGAHISEIMNRPGFLNESVEDEKQEENQK